MRHPSFDYVLAGLLLAAALVLPVFFHLLGLGSAFLPMFYPLALAGFLVAPRLAVVVGVSAPLLSALLTGMPPFYPPVAFIMMAEGLVFTALPQPLRRVLRLGDWPALLAVLVIDRVLLLGLVQAMAVAMDLPPRLLGWAAAARGLPGLILMMAVLPLVIPSLRARKDRVVSRHEQE